MLAARSTRDDLLPVTFYYVFGQQLPKRILFICVWAQCAQTHCKTYVFGQFLEFRRFFAGFRRFLFTTKKRDFIVRRFLGLLKEAKTF